MGAEGGATPPVGEASEPNWFPQGESSRCWDPVSAMALRWGIVSAGLISSDFTTVLQTLPRSEHQVRPPPAPGSWGRAGGGRDSWVRGS